MLETVAANLDTGIHAGIDDEARGEERLQDVVAVEAVRILEEPGLQAQVGCVHAPSLGVGAMQRVIAQIVELFVLELKGEVEMVAGDELVGGDDAREVALQQLLRRLETSRMLYWSSLSPPKSNE